MIRRAAARVAHGPTARVAFAPVLSAPLLPVTDRRVRSRRSRFARRLLLVAGFALVLGSCSSNHGPKDYTADVESNFVRSCQEENPVKKDVPDALQFCQCVYGKVKDTYTFDEFKLLDSKLRTALADSKTVPKSPGDLNTIDTRYVGVVDSCRTTGPVAPASNSASTTTIAAAVTTTASK